MAHGQHVAVALAVGWTFVDGGRAFEFEPPFLLGVLRGNDSVLSVFGSGTLTAVFVPTLFAVTLRRSIPRGTRRQVPIVLNHQVVHTGDTMYLTWGAHSLQLFAEDALQEWTVTPGTGISSLHAYTVSITVHGAGTIYAILEDSDAGNDSHGNHVPYHSASGVTPGSGGPMGIRPE